MIQKFGKQIGKSEKIMKIGLKTRKTGSQSPKMPFLRCFLPKIGSKLNPTTGSTLRAASGATVTRDVVLIYMRGQAVRTTLNENVMARL
jgi:hypothetical protein